MIEVREDPLAVTFAVRVSPRASRAAIAGIHGTALKVSLTSPPVEGAANAELVALLARALSVPKRAMAIVHGEKSRTKTVRIEGVGASAIHALVGGSIAW